jgi:hypothetical protein
LQEKQIQAIKTAANLTKNAQIDKLLEDFYLNQIIMLKRSKMVNRKPY